MARDNDGFNLDDMLEIFGDAAAQARAGASAQAPVPAGEELTADEQDLLRAYEQRKEEQRLREEIRKVKERKEAKESEEREERRLIEDFERKRAARAATPAPAPAAPLAPPPAPITVSAPLPPTVAAPAPVPVPAPLPAPAVPAPPALAPPPRGPVPAPVPAPSAPAGLVPPLPPHAGPPTDIEAAENEAFCAMLEETRTVMLAFLVPLIGIKAAANMLNKSIEKAREKAPLALKDANWRLDGTLREDGSLDPERMLRNAAGLPRASRVEEYVSGLRALVDLRVRAVEAGLGADARAELRARLLASRGVLGRKLAQPIPPAWLDLFCGRVLA